MPMAVMKKPFLAWLVMQKWFGLKGFIGRFDFACPILYKFTDTLILIVKLGIIEKFDLYYSVFCTSECMKCIIEIFWVGKIIILIIIILRTVWCLWVLFMAQATRMWPNVCGFIYNTFIVWQKLQLKVTFFCILWITSQNNYLRCVWFYCLTLLAIYRENRSNIWSLFVIKLVIKLLNRDSVILPIHRSATMSNFSFSIKSAPLSPNSIQRDSKIWFEEYYKLKS